VSLGADHIVGKGWGKGGVLGMWRTESHVPRIISQNQEEEKEEPWSLTSIMCHPHPSPTHDQCLRLVLMTDLRYQVQI